MKLNNFRKIKINGSKLKIAIILPYFNEILGLELFKNCRKELLENKVKIKNISLTRVAGSLEIPFACQKIIQNKKPDALIALGIIIKGQTKHFDLVAETTYQGLIQVQLLNKIPISFGILACNNEKQARERVNSKGLNKGRDAAIAALIQTTI